MNYLALVLFCLWVLTELLSGRNAASPVPEGLADQVTEYGEAMASDYPIFRDPGDRES